MFGECPSPIVGGRPSEGRDDRRTLVSLGPMTADSIRGLVRLKVPEGPSLEYKAAIPLGKKRERREALKDLTAIANGGGGTIIVGVTKDPPAPQLPKDLAPLRD